MQKSRKAQKSCLTFSIRWIFMKLRQITNFILKSSLQLGRKWIAEWLPCFITINVDSTHSNPIH